MRPPQQDFCRKYSRIVLCISKAVPQIPQLSSAMHLCRALMPLIFLLVTWIWPGGIISSCPSIFLLGFTVEVTVCHSHPPFRMWKHLLPSSCIGVSATWLIFESLPRSCLLSQGSLYPLTGQCRYKVLTASLYKGTFLKGYLHSKTPLAGPGSRHLQSQPLGG